MDQLTCADAIEFEDLARTTVPAALTAAAQGAPTARQAAAIVAAVEQVDAGDVLRRPYPDVVKTAIAAARSGQSPAATPQDAPDAADEQALRLLLEQVSEHAAQREQGASSEDLTGEG